MVHVHVTSPSSKDSSPQQTLDDGFIDTASFEVFLEVPKDTSDYENSGSSHNNIICDLLMQDLGKPDQLHQCQ